MSHVNFINSTKSRAVSYAARDLRTIRMCGSWWLFHMCMRWIGMYVCMSSCLQLNVHMCAYAYEDLRLISDIFLIILLRIHKGRPVAEPVACCLGWSSQLTSSGESFAPASCALGFQADRCIMFLIRGFWGSELQNSHLHCKALYLLSSLPSPMIGT